MHDFSGFNPIVCERLTVTLLHFLWQGAVIGVVAAVLSRLPDTVITSWTVLHQRTPTMTRGELETVLKDKFGVFRVVWMEGSTAGDLTDGHVDGSRCCGQPRSLVVIMIFVVNFIRFILIRHGPGRVRIISPP